MILEKEEKYILYLNQLNERWRITFGSIFIIKKEFKTARKGNKMKRNAKIAELILRAQNASDGGKQKSSYNTSSIKAYTDNYAGYKHKDLCIYNAIQLILTGNSKFKFSVQDDKQKIAYFLVYFEKCSLFLLLNNYLKI